MPRRPESGSRCSSSQVDPTILKLFGDTTAINVVSNSKKVVAYRVALPEQRTDIELNANREKITHDEKKTDRKSADLLDNCRVLYGPVDVDAKTIVALRRSLESPDLSEWSGAKL